LLCSHELGALPRRREDTAAAAIEAIEEGAPLASFRVAVVSASSFFAS
jgi:hypothetical protein